MEIEVDEDVSYEDRPIQILDVREQVLKGKTISLVEVLWLHHGVKEATWKRKIEVNEKYSDLFSNL